MHSFGIPLIILSLIHILRGVQADYTVMDIPPQELSQKTATLRTLQGFNITIPHKQAILPYLDEMDLSLIHIWDHFGTGFCRAGQ